MTTSSSGYRANLEALLRAQKPSVGTAAYSRHVNRPLGRRLAAAAHAPGLTPNGATAISASMTATAFALLLLVHPSPVQAIAVGALLAGGYVMDSVDGQLARLRGGGSLAGEWLDHTVDCVKDAIIHLAVLVSWYRFPWDDHTAWLVVPLLYSVISTVTYFGLIFMPMLRERRPVVPATSAESGPEVTESPLRKWLLLPHDYGVLAWSFVLLAWPVVFAVVYSAFALVNGAALLWALRKWWSELRALDREAQGLPSAR